MAERGTPELVTSKRNIFVKDVNMPLTNPTAKNVTKYHPRPAAELSLIHALKEYSRKEAVCVLAGFVSTRHKLESSERRKLQLRKRFRKIRL